MTWRLVAIALGVVIYLIVLVGAIEGSTAMAGVVITVTALVVFVGGGNWLQHWLGIRRRPPQFARPDRHRDDEPPTGEERAR